VPSTYLTKSGFEGLSKELEFLRKVKRQEIADLLRDSNGGDEFDGDTDPEFSIAKHQQAFLEGRILELENLLSNPFIIDHYLHSDVVEVGSKVTISEDGGDPVSYTIVGPAEASPSVGLISFASPLGSAMIGHSAGDQVIVKSPGGMYRVCIQEVS
jgi:transcription elongation factor GreA